MDKQVKALNKESFKRWLARQPEERRFHYHDIHGCLFCCFAKEELGFKEAGASGDFFIDGAGNRYALPLPFQRAAVNANPLTIANFKAELAKQLHKESL